VDGHIWKSQPKNLLTGYGCPVCGREKCNKAHLLTHNEFLERLEKSNKNYKNKKIEIISEYSGLRRKIKCRCNVDGCEWGTSPQSLINGSGCPKCSKVYRMSHEEFVERLNKINSNVILLSKYENMKDKLKLKCKVCSNEFQMSGNTLSSGQGCPKCGRKKGNKSKTKHHEEFLVELKIKNDSIEILSTYAKAREKVLCRCTECNNVWEATPHKLLLKRGNTGCPKCNASKGELAVETYCKSNNIKFIPQYKIDKCKHKQSLPFDFALFNKNKLVALVEYQGKQHYESVKHYGGEKEFNLRRKRDKIKRDYCKLNNIPLIEISYREKNIEGYLENNIREITKGNEF
jgi:hypothetical protein